MLDLCSLKPSLLILYDFLQTSALSENIFFSPLEVNWSQSLLGTVNIVEFLRRSTLQLPSAQNRSLERERKKKKKNPSYKGKFM